MLIKRFAQEVESMVRQSYPTIKRSSFWLRLKRDMIRNWRLYVLILPAIIALVLFRYAPMYGLQIAFKNFKPAKGIADSAWVGFKHFKSFINSYQFEKVLWNTISISVTSLIAGFPMPIIFALLLNQIRSQRAKKVLQTVTYMPHFISTVVLVGMLMVFLSPTTGLYGHAMRAFGISQPDNLLAQKEWFTPLYVLSGIWQNTGWDSIIYLAALSAISVDLYEAATVDGASKFKRMIYIDIPCIMPTAIILLIMNMGNIFSLGFEKIYLMQNNLNLPVSETINTYVYKQGIIGGKYSYSAAIGLFNTVINFVILLTVNKIAGKVSDTSLF